MDFVDDIGNKIQLKGPSIDQHGDFSGDREGIEHIVRRAIQSHQYTHGPSQTILNLSGFSITDKARAFDMFEEAFNDGGNPLKKSFWIIWGELPGAEIARDGI